MAKASWIDPSLYVNQIYIEESCLDLEYTQEILTRTSLPWSVVPERGKPNEFDDEYVANLTRGKRQLFLCANRGQFFKPCPATREYRCCDYQVLNTGANCPIDCAYCILQAYLNTPWLYHYVNIDTLFKELETGLMEKKNSFFRIGTGEFTDSLALDTITGLSKKLVPKFSKYDNAILELKTKSGVVDNLQGLDHGGKSVIAWSLNGQRIVNTYEIRGATLDERLQAASRCAQWGYKLAFHFDPIIDYEGWQQEYSETIQKLYRMVPPEAIVWISLGALRYLPKLKEIGIKRFPQTTIYYNEFIQGLDGKERYFRTNRVKLYRHLYRELKKYAADSTCIYFCMESDEIWHDVMGYIPDEKGGLPQMLDEAIIQQKQ